MMLKELNTDIENHRVITYAVNHDKAVYHNMNMRHAFGCIYIGEAYDEGYGQIYHMVYAYFPEKKIGIALCMYRDDTDIENIKAYTLSNGLENLSTFIKSEEAKINANSWLTLLEVELLKVVAPELVEPANESRRIFRERLDEQERIRKQKQKKEEEAYVKEQNNEAEEIIRDAIEIVKKGGNLLNKEFTIYNGRYDYKNYSTVGYLLEKYGISIPIRTKGWINSKLACMQIDENGNVSNVRYYKTGKSKGSTTFWDYIFDLVKAVRSED